MHRRASRTLISAKIVKTCDKTGGIAARIGRTIKETAAIFGKTTETCEQTVRICDKTRGAFLRTGKIPVTTVKISKAIARICEEIVMISKPIDGIGIRIGRTFKETVRIGEPTSRSSVAAINNGQASVDRARFGIRERRRRGVFFKALRVFLFLKHAPSNDLVRRALRHPLPHLKNPAQPRQ
jgi:hypothetical protein